MAKRGQCQECYGLLEGDRRARYCSDACKMRAYRKRKKRDAAGKDNRRGAARPGSKPIRAAALNGRRLPVARGRLAVKR